ncbi:signal peptide peptidase SppA [Candidatus Woesearchaeota archaeon]|nr:signal peptide peptidase SppA [Candidatus Woesearchaeota archaeon]
MKKRGTEPSKTKSIVLTIVAVLVFVFIILPLAMSLFDGSKVGNVASIPIEGPITGDGGNYLGSPTASSVEIVAFIKEAGTDPQIKVILVEINSPGGSAVASDEIASALKKTEKPVVALIREVGASGGYWIASAADQIIANKMSITGSIGVISSYLEFSGLMEEYGVGYERLVAGKYKDMGVPFRELQDEERAILQTKLNKIHGFFIEEIAANRDLPVEKVKGIATGEFYLGIEALNLGLVDQVGDKDTAEQFMKDAYGLKEIDYVVYERELGFFDALASVFAEFSFRIGEGLGSIFAEQQKVMLI